MFLLIKHRFSTYDFTEGPIFTNDIKRYDEDLK